ncbi:MAG: CheR family methyltransferase [Archangium sp.]|nr:CheR family methyltransferase [Archangium sp.]
MSERLFTPPSRRELAAQACALAGVREEVAHLNLRHLLGSARPASPPRDPTLQQVLEEVTTGETFFFRQSAHFHFLTPLLLEFARHGHVRAWSAGCSTGEEAHSLAAWASALVGDHASVEVLGTDIVESRLSIASAGVYGPWSMRNHESCPFSVVERDGAGYRVLPAVRRLTRFLVHNLLEPRPREAGTFDFIFCRNVLIYLTPAAATHAVKNLLSALKPRGVLVFAPVDLVGPPEQLTPLGPPELSCYMRASEAAPATLAIRQPPAHAKAAPSAAPVMQRTSVLARVIERHAEAVSVAEAGRSRGALRLLDELSGEAAGYVPALLERALLRLRLGENGTARELAGGVLARLEHLDADARVDGPVPLSAAYYRAAALALLERAGPKR